MLAEIKYPGWFWSSSLWVLQIARVDPNSDELIAFKRVGFTGTGSEVGSFIQGLQEEGWNVLEKKRF